MFIFVFQLLVFNFYLLVLLSRSDVLHHLDAKIREDDLAIPVSNDVAICPLEFFEKGNDIAFMNKGRELRGERFLSFCHVYYFFYAKVPDKILPYHPDTMQ